MNDLTQDLINIDKNDYLDLKHMQFENDYIHYNNNIVCLMQYNEPYHKCP